MPFQPTRPPLRLAEDVRGKLISTAASRTEPISRVERARMLVGYAEGETVSALARRLRTNRPRVERCIDKALQVGPLAALDDLPRPGKPATITPEARAWVISLACEKPAKYGYSYELWTTDLLARHVRDHCHAADHPSLAHLTRGTVSKFLRQSQTRPHKITYYVERRDSASLSQESETLNRDRESSGCITRTPGGRTPIPGRRTPIPGRRNQFPG